MTSKGLHHWALTTRVTESRSLCKSSLVPLEAPCTYNQALLILRCVRGPFVWLLSFRGIECFLHFIVRVKQRRALKNTVGLCYILMPWFISFRCIFFISRPLQIHLGPLPIYRGRCLLNFFWLIILYFRYNPPLSINECPYGLYTPELSASGMVWRISWNLLICSELLRSVPVNVQNLNSQAWFKLSTLWT